MSQHELCRHRHLTGNIFFLPLFIFDSFFQNYLAFNTFPVFPVTLSIEHRTFSPHELHRKQTINSAPHFLWIFSLLLSRSALFSYCLFLWVFLFFILKTCVHTIILCVFHFLSSIIFQYFYLGISFSFHLLCLVSFENEEKKTQRNFYISMLWN